MLGYSGPELAPLLARYRLTQTVVSTEHARALDACGRRLAVHLKVDTGLHRLGIPWDDTQSLTAPYSCSHLRVTGVFTHLADTGAAGRGQPSPYPGATPALSGSGGWPALRRTRPRNRPLPGQLRPAQLPRPPLRLRPPRHRPCTASSAPPATPPRRSLPSARCSPCGPGVSQLHTLAAGEAAGYDGAYTAHRPTVLATLSIGYADGWPCTLSNGAGRVLLHGRTAPIVGLICMDQLLVDVTDMEGVAPGDTATLIGRDGDAVLTAEEAAQAAGTITNELLSRLGPRLERVVLP